MNSAAQIALAKKTAVVYSTTADGNRSVRRRRLAQTELLEVIPPWLRMCEQLACEKAIVPDIPTEIIADNPKTGKGMKVLNLYKRDIMTWACKQAGSFAVQDYADAFNIDRYTGVYRLNILVGAGYLSSFIIPHGNGTIIRIRYTTTDKGRYYNSN